MHGIQNPPISYHNHFPKRAFHTTYISYVKAVVLVLIIYFHIHVPTFKYKDYLPRYRIPIIMIKRSYHYNGNSNICKATFLYWNSPRLVALTTKIIIKSVTSWTSQIFGRIGPQWLQPGRPLSRIVQENVWSCSHVSSSEENPPITITA